MKLYRRPHGRKAHRFWVVIHNEGGVWAATFAYWRSVTIMRFMERRVKVPGYSWRKAYREGFRATPVYLARAPKGKR